MDRLLLRFYQRTRERLYRGYTLAASNHRRTDVLQGLQNDCADGGVATEWNPDFRQRAVMRCTWNLVQLVEHMKSCRLYSALRERLRPLHVLRCGTFSPNFVSGGDPPEKEFGWASPPPAKLEWRL